MGNNPFADLLSEIEGGQAPPAVSPSTDVAPEPEAPKMSDDLSKYLRRSMMKRKYKRHKGADLTTREESMIDNDFLGMSAKDAGQSPEILRFMGEETGRKDEIEKFIEATKLEKPSDEEMDPDLTWRKAQEGFINHKGWTEPLTKLAGVGLSIPASIEEKSLKPLWEGVSGGFSPVNTPFASPLSRPGGEAVMEGVGRVFGPGIEAIKSGADPNLSAWTAAKEKFLHGKNLGSEAHDKLFADIAAEIPDEDLRKDALNIYAKISGLSIDLLPVDPTLIAGKMGKLGWLAKRAGVAGEKLDKLVMRAPEALNALEDMIRAKIGAKVPERYTPEMIGQIDKAKRDAYVFAKGMAKDAELGAKQEAFNERMAKEVQEQAGAVGGASDMFRKKMGVEGGGMQRIKSRAEAKAAEAGEPMTKLTAQKEALRQQAVEKAAAKMPVKDKAALLRKLKQEEARSMSEGGTRSVDEIADDLAGTQLQNEKVAQYQYDLVNREMYGPERAPQPLRPLMPPRPLSAEQRMGMAAEGVAKSDIPTPIMRRWDMGPKPEMKVVKPREGMRTLQEAGDDAMDYARAQTRETSLLDDEPFPEPKMSPRALPSASKPLPAPSFTPEQVKAQAASRAAQGDMIRTVEENPKGLLDQWAKKAKDLIDNPKDLGAMTAKFARDIEDVERITGKAIDPIIKSSIRERYVAANELTKADSAAKVYEKTKLGNGIDKFLGAFGAKAWDDIIMGKAWLKLPRGVREAFVRTPDSKVGEIAQIHKEIADIKKVIVGEQLEEMTKVLTGKALGKAFTEEEKMYAWALSQGEKATIPAGLRGDDIRKAAAEARAIIDRAGEVFVRIVPEDARRMLSDETFLKNYGVYMPRYYKRFEMADVWERAANKYLAPAWRDKYLGERTLGRTLPEHMTEKYGIIKSPVVAARGAMDLANDAFTHQFYRDLADNSEMTRFLPRGAEAPAGMRKMPKNEKVGPLSSSDNVDAYVTDDVYWMLHSDMKDEAKGFAKFMSDANDFLMGYWKPAMTVLNLTSYAHNAWGALNMNAAGTGRIIGSPSMSKGLAKSGHALVADTEIARQARADGVFKGNWAKVMSGQQKKAIQESLTILDAADGNAIAWAKEMARKVKVPYQAIDDINKLDIYQYGLSQGMGRREAALYARKWGIDWERAGYMIKALGRGPVPFISYSALAIPRYLEASLKRPLATNAHGLALAAVHEYGARKWGMSEKDQATEENILKGDWYAHRNLMRWPFGKPGEYADVSYIVPWSAMQTQGVKDMIFGSPYWSVVEAAWNKDRHLNRPIYDEKDPDNIARQKVQTFLKRRWLPGIAPGGYFYERAKAAINETPDYAGQVKPFMDFATEAAMGYRGINVDFEKELKRIKEEDKSRKSYLKGQITKTRNSVEAKRMSQAAADKNIEEFQNELDALTNKNYPDAPRIGAGGGTISPEQLVSILRSRR